MDPGPMASGWFYLKPGRPAESQVGPLAWEELWQAAQSGGLAAERRGLACRLARLGAGRLRWPGCSPRRPRQARADDRRGVRAGRGWSRAGVGHGRAPSGWSSASAVGSQGDRLGRRTRVGRTRGEAAAANRARGR